VDADPQSGSVIERGAWARPVSLRGGELAVAVVLFATGVFFAWQAAKMPFGTIRLPGPVFFPFVLGTLLSLCSLAIAAGTLRASRDGKNLELGHRDVLVVFAALAGAALVFERLGAYASLGLFTVTVLLLVARLSILISLAAASVGMIAVWLAFQVVLKVQLPAGPF